MPDTSRPSTANTASPGAMPARSAGPPRLVLTTTASPCACAASCTPTPATVPCRLARRMAS
eukprot:scaffold271_cov336-Pavlova_lutheri.AAC.27